MFSSSDFRKGLERIVISLASIVLLGTISLHDRNQNINIASAAEQPPYRIYVPQTNSQFRIVHETYPLSDIYMLGTNLTKISNKNKIVNVKKKPKISDYRTVVSFVNDTNAIAESRRSVFADILFNTNKFKNFSIERIIYEKNQDPSTFRWRLENNVSQELIESDLTRIIRASSGQHIEVNLPSFDVMLIEGHKVLCRYKSRVGKNSYDPEWSRWNNTPIGVAYVSEKRNSALFFDDNQNILIYSTLSNGQVIKIDYSKIKALALIINGKDAYSIHSTTDYHLIGRTSSSGCIGLRIDDMLALYSKTKPNIPVIITYNLVTVGPDRAIEFNSDIYKKGVPKLECIIPELRYYYAINGLDPEEVITDLYLTPGPEGCSMFSGGLSFISDSRAPSGSPGAVFKKISEDFMSRNPVVRIEPLGPSKKKGPFQTNVVYTNAMQTADDTQTNH